MRRTTVRGARLRQWALAAGALLISLLFSSDASACRLWAAQADAGHEFWGANWSRIGDQLQVLESQGSDYHRDGWAVMYYHQGTFGDGGGDESGDGHGRLWRSAAATDGYDPNVSYDEMESELHYRPGVTSAMGHVRNSSSGCGCGEGEDTPANPHPWFWTTADGTVYTFAHNGTLDKELLYNLLTDGGSDPSWLEAHPPTTFEEVNGCGGDWLNDGWQYVVDSELYFSWLMKNIVEEAGGDVKRGLQLALSHPQLRYQDQDKNFVFSDGAAIWAYRMARSDDSTSDNFRHSLYFKAENNGPRAYKAVMSQPTGLWDWTEMNNHELVYLPREGEVERHPNFDCTWLLPGDANQDGAVDVLDLIALRDVILGNAVFSNRCSELVTDMNGDGTFDILDIVTLVNQILGR